MHLFWTNKPYMNSFKSLNCRRKIGIWVILFWPDCLWHCDTPPRHAGQDSCLLFAGKCCSGCWFLLLSSLSGSDLAYRNPSQAPRSGACHTHHDPASGHKTLNTNCSLEIFLLTADWVWRDDVIYELTQFTSRSSLKTSKHLFISQEQIAFGH